MKTIQSIQSLRRVLKPLHQKGKTVGLIPTMGAFHEGHLSLMRKAQKECDVVVVSLFVNPIQFGPKEDLERYPRDLQKDKSLARQEQVDILFLPHARKLFSAHFQTFVSAERLSKPLCGASRPRHFRGVATIVAKLFNIVQPDIAYFGQKDYQQAQIIRQIASDLSYNIQIRVLPTVREKDGLALSSRNAYLRAEERKQAAKIYQALRETKRAFQRGEKNTKRLEGILKRELQSVFRNSSIEYAEVRDGQTLAHLDQLKRHAVAAAAVKVGKARLIDNIVLEG